MHFNINNDLLFQRLDAVLCFGGCHKTITARRTNKSLILYLKKMLFVPWIFGPVDFPSVLWKSLTHRT